MNRRNRSTPRGSALVVAMIVLGVLTVIGVAAVSLSTQERSNAAAYGKLDAMQACANAATAKIWRELGIYGTSLATSDATITSVRLADGTTLKAPAHYDTPVTATVRQVVTTAASPTALNTGGDLTNRLRAFSPPGAGGGAGGVNLFIVHCKDASGRELELEIGIQFAL